MIGIFPMNPGTAVKRVRLGDALAALGRKVGLTDEHLAITDQMRDIRRPSRCSSNADIGAGQ
jgi:hypothetical protein